MASSVADQWFNTNVDELEGNQKKATKITEGYTKCLIMTGFKSSFSLSDKINYFLLFSHVLGQAAGLDDHRKSLPTEIILSCSILF